MSTSTFWPQWLRPYSFGLILILLAGSALAEDPVSQPVSTAAPSSAATVTAAPQPAAPTAVSTGSTTTSSAAPTPTAVDMAAPQQCQPASANTSHTCEQDNGGMLLQLDRTYYTLPKGMLKQPYKQALRAFGGQLPYTFNLAVEDTLPPGIGLSNEGILSGQPTRAGSWSFYVQLTDAKQRSVVQRYILNVSAPASLDKKNSPLAPKSEATPATLEVLSPEDAQNTAKKAIDIEVYRLLPKTLDLLKSYAPAPVSAEAMPELTFEITAKDEATAVAAAVATSTAFAGIPPGAPPIQLTETGATQLKQMLEPLLNVEYPSRVLFEAALDAQLCQYTSVIITASAQKNKQLAPDREQLAAACPPDWAALEKASSAPAKKTVRWQDFPAELMSAPLRKWLIERAAQTYPVDVNQTIQWNGAGCGCVLQQLSRQVYGFYPNWWAQGVVQQLHFDLMTRISVFALPFDSEGNIVEATDKAFLPQSAFIRTAQKHNTQLDLTLYRNDWQFLQNTSTDRQKSISQQLAKQARTLIDKEIDDTQARIEHWIPGLSNTPRLANGITLYLDNIPASGTPLQTNFQNFYNQLLTTMIAELRTGSRPYTLNVVLYNRDLLNPQNTWLVHSLYNYMQQAEHTVSANNGAQSENSNLTLRYIVLLSEPNASNRDQLINTLDDESGAKGKDLRILQKKIIPVISTGNETLKLLNDDLAFFAQDFGGVGFWPSPLIGVTAGEDVEKALRNNFLPNQPRQEALCDMICEQRWLLHIAFKLLLFLSVVAVVLYFAWCRVRQLGLIYLLGLALSILPMLIIGGLLLSCDPLLAQLREGNTLLFVLVTLLVIGSLFLLLKPRVETP